MGSVQLHVLDVPADVHVGLLVDLVAAALIPEGQLLDSHLVEVDFLQPYLPIHHHREADLFFLADFRLQERQLPKMVIFDFDLIPVEAAHDVLSQFVLHDPAIHFVHVHFLQTFRVLLTAHQSRDHVLQQVGGDVDVDESIGL